MKFDTMFEIELVMQFDDFLQYVLFRLVFEFM